MDLNVADEFKRRFGRPKTSKAKTLYKLILLPLHNRTHEYFEAWARPTYALALPSGF